MRFLIKSFTHSDRHIGSCVTRDNRIGACHVLNFKRISYTVVSYMPRGATLKRKFYIESNI